MDFNGSFRVAVTAFFSWMVKLPPTQKDGFKAKNSVKPTVKIRPDEARPDLFLGGGIP